MKDLKALQKELTERAKRAFEGSIKIGWIDGNGSGEKANENRLFREATGQPTNALGVPYSLAGIARTLNFGREAGVTAEGRKYPAIPARPFMTLAMDQIKNDLPLLLKYDPKAREHIKNIMQGKGDPDALKKYLGALFVGTVKRAMRGEFGQFVPLSPKTIEQRRKPHGKKAANGNPQPLIDTGHLINSVTFEITK